ncbi:MAG: nickel-dependent lactate racemase [Synergistaceae bacterium]|nr:nickel-dependent lactate racemase [Synergistaceae bacterium]
MRLDIPFGEIKHSFNLPDKNLLFIDQVEDVNEIQDLRQAIFDMLDKPIGTPPLRSLTKEKQNIVILIEDNTRHTPLKQILPVLLEYLAYCNVPDRNISFLTAPGTHRIMSVHEIIEKVGEDIYNRFRIYQHDVTKPDELYDEGYVEAGGYRIPIQVNKKAVDADLLMGIGEIVPHSDAGYSAGAKIVQPGVCGYATTAATHVLAALQDRFPIGVADNLCRSGIEKVAEKVGLSFILNIVKNQQGKVCGVFAGDFIKAHRKGCYMAEKVYSIPIPMLADVVVVSSWPCDIDYWQAGKALIAAATATKPGGIIIFATPCPERIAHNHPKLNQWLKMSLAQAINRAKEISPENVDADLVSADIAIANARVRENADVYVISDGLTEEDIDVLGFRRFLSVQEALDEALRRIPGATIGILRKGGIAFPVVKTQNANV